MPSLSDRLNVFAGPHTDRSRPPRNDAEAVAAALASPGALLAPVWRSRSLLERGDRPRAALLPAAQWPALLSDPSSLLLLGTWRESTVFALEFPAATEPAFPDSLEFADLRMLGGLLEPDEAGLLAYARALVWWRARHRYCGACGAPTEPRDAGHVMRCTVESCGHQAFPRIDPAIIVLVSDGDRTLLGRQASWPPGRYSTIAGFVEPGESLEDTVVREVFEETGVRVTDVRYHSSQPWPFPSSLMVGFEARATSTEVSCNDAELEDARWFSREQLARGEPALPPAQSISYRLIEDWYNAGAARPLAQEPDARVWDKPKR
ncbi:MAG: NAD(+) diphosphatase [Gammaproteobacteria bacterium]|nr:NAD(+) diphosphatase [Gammaproteobacteria bacterium]